MPPQPNGQMLLEYRDEESLKITHVSYHQVSRILPGIELSLSEAEAERHSLLFIEGTFGPLTYVILTKLSIMGRISITSACRGVSGWTRKKTV
jgi:hypothetical protein